MNWRERYFNLISGRKVDQLLFFPDITDWYNARRTPPGQPHFLPGAFIPDSDPIHKENVDMPKEYQDFTLLDFYKNFDWGLPVHLYNWYDTEYEGVEEKILQDEKKRIIQYICPAGELERVYILANDGSWAPHGYLVNELKELDIVKYIVSHSRIVQRPDRFKAILDEINGQGVIDIPIWRSPFGKLIHEYLGFEKTIYALYDHKDVILRFMEFQEEYDLKVIEMASNYPANIVIISDHADENLISPKFYKEYCIPFYQKATKILHDKGKIVSTHLDGNFKSFFPYLMDTGFDLLDGCTPAPMFNYEPEELALACKGRIYAYCGIPATLFIQHLDDSRIVEFGARIAQAFKNRVILNVGDILPPGGDIKQVIKLGEWAKTLIV